MSTINIFIEMYTAPERDELLSLDTCIARPVNCLKNYDVLHE